MRPPNPTEQDRMRTEDKILRAEEKKLQDIKDQDFIADAEVFRKELANPSPFWIALKKYFNLRKDVIHQCCFNREPGFLPEDPVSRLIDIEVYQGSYVNMKQWINIPDAVIKKAELVLKAQEIEQEENEKKLEAINAANDPQMKR